MSGTTSSFTIKYGDTESEDFTSILSPTDISSDEDENTDENLILEIGCKTFKANETIQKEPGVKKEISDAELQ